MALVMLIDAVSTVIDSSPSADHSRLHDFVLLSAPRDNFLSAGD